MKKGKIEKYQRSADLANNASGQFVNYGVRKKLEGKYRTSRILAVCGYIAFALAYFLILASLNILPIIALLPVLTWILVFFTWRWVSVEYEYYILDGEMRMLEVFGSKNSRELCRVRISAMSRIAPYEGKYQSTADKIPESNRIMGVSSLSSPDVYFALYKDESGEEIALFFEATEKTLKVMKYYNSEAVVAAKTTH